ncbi:transcription repressor NadR [Erysipelothrix urinaevulpis]|uniref:transcription repressor NadR n=1 Tax=Erysipelothrix urinaevulpis TaxID=2683717 RepID=UPI001358989A|nr:transcription repressor NadR [Erysipelothrix urinaevulpis]
MSGNQRRENILNYLHANDSAYPARKFAEMYNVSRQVIVGDIALLRAEGHAIIATSKGYIFKHPQEGLIRKNIVMNHNQDQTRLELEIFVKHNVLVESVTVEHPVYGELTGQLNIKNHEDIDDFLSLEAELLSTLTDGVHIHTIYYPQDLDFNELYHDLDHNQLLYHND